MMEQRVCRAALRLLGRWVVPAGVAMTLALSAWSQEACHDDCVKVDSWQVGVSLGAGLVRNPLLGGDNIPLVVLPHVRYYGRHLFLDDLEGGVTLLETDRQSLDLLVSPGYDRAYFYRRGAQGGLLGANLFSAGIQTYNSSPPGPVVSGTLPTASGSAGAIPVGSDPQARQFTVLAGPQWTWDAHPLSGRVALLHDVSGRDQGVELRAAVMLQSEVAGGQLRTHVGAVWKDSRIVNYYYGETGVYSAGSAFDPFAKIAYEHVLQGHWRFTSFVRIERLGSSIADSPLVARSIVPSAFAGFTYSIP